MTLRRTAFLRTTPDAATLTVKVRRARACKICTEKFIPWSTTQTACSPDCAHKVAEQVRLKAERKDVRERRERLKSRGDWLADVQKVFNLFIRLRDKDQPCICCGRTNVKDYLTGSAWDAGHYRSVGSAQHLRFDENNVHRQLVYCNKDRSGNAVEYRRGLIVRIGLAAVESLEADQQPRKYTIPDLKAMKAEYAAKVKQLKART